MWHWSGTTRGAAVLSILLAVSIAGCNRERLGDPGSPDDVDWKTGPAASYPVDAAAGQSISDSLSGQHFLFPEGGHGTLRVARILSGPAAPFSGEGFEVSFGQEVPLQLVVNRPGSDVVMVLGYGTAPGAYDDATGAAARWLAVPRVDSLAAGQAFQLTLPVPAAPSGFGRLPLAATPGFSHYWITSIPAGSDDATRRVHLQLQASTFVDGILDRLSPTRAAAARAEVQGRLRANYAWDGLFYTGFWWRSLGSMGRLVHPTIHLNLNANAGNVAHETGHYVTHVLVGDDVWSTLEGQAPLWDTGHGIRDQVGRNMLLEDYAYFEEWLMEGTVKSYDLLDPYVIFSGLTPLNTDFPGLEGFGSVLLAGLTRTAPTLRDLINGKPTEVPVLGLSAAQVHDIIAGGATGVEALRERIATAAGGQADRLPALFQRSGWRYAVRGRLITETGAPLAGATVSSVSLVGEHVYRGGSSSIPSDGSGHFSITGEVFPGASRIRVWNGQDSIDVAVSIPWTQRTDQVYDLGDLQVRRPVDLAPLHYCSIDLFTNAYFEMKESAQERYERVEITAIAGSFSGGRFTGSRDSTDSGSGLHITTSLTVDVNPASGDIQTLDLTQTRATPGGWSETLHLSLVDVAMSSYSVYPPRILMECSVFEEAVCGHLTTYTWGGASADFWSNMTWYNCTPDHANGYRSHLRVYFHNGRQM